MERPIERPREDIRIVHALIRDMKEQMRVMERDFSAKVNVVQFELNKLKQKIESKSKPLNT